MAAGGAGAAGRTLQFSTLFARSTTRTSSFASKASSLSGLCASKPTSGRRFSIRKLNLSRLPVQLGGALSLMPLHSVTASALYSSLLSLHSDSWGCLSEGFATPL